MLHSPPPPQPLQRTVLEPVASIDISNLHYPLTHPLYLRFRLFGAEEGTLKRISYEEFSLLQEDICNL